MRAPHLTHDIVCIGAHDPQPHDFHAANARAVCNLFSGGLAPSRLAADCIAGPRVKTAAVASALASAAERAAKNHIVYFSGCGTRLGLEVSDGAITPEMLERHVTQVRAHAVLLILDLAIGAEPDQALTPPWLRSLVQARPHVRAAVARATRIGAGLEGEGLARFTAAFIAALESSPGDVRHERVRFISDRQAFDHTRQTLERRWGVIDFPVEIGRFGDMPLARSQASAPVGIGAVEAIVPGAGLSASVNWILEGRANVTTIIEHMLERSDGTVLGRGITEIVPKNPLQKGKTRVRLPRSVLGRGVDASSRTAALRWRVVLRDVPGHVLATRFIKLA